MKNPKRLTELARTRRGDCARCGEGPGKHDKGKCPDGKGDFTWAQTREDMKRTIDGLKALQRRMRGDG